MRHKALALLSSFLLLLLTVGSASASPGTHRGLVKPAVIPTTVVPDLGFSGKLMTQLRDRLATAAPGDAFDVIVQLNQRPDAALYHALEQAAGGAITYKAQWTRALQGFSASLTKAQIAALQQRPEVKTIEPDLTAQATLDSSTRYTGAQQARADFGVDGSRGYARYSSSNVVVAIIDTGIDVGHVDLGGGKVIGWDDEVNHATSPYDDQGHGSHVSGIVAGTGAADPAYTGYAPGAALVGVKVLNSSGSGSFTTIINGINWMITHKETYGIKVANMSLGGSGCSDGTDALSTAVNNAVSQGIAMVVAAGNSGPATCTISSPAAAARAITVGAVADPKLDASKAGWFLANFSSRGPTLDGRIKPDIVAPGYHITSVNAGSGNGYVTMSGTSMATPAVAGIAALMLSANYSLTPDQIKSTLMNTATDYGPAGPDKDWGAGTVQAYAAIKQAGGYGYGSFSDGTTHGHAAGYLGGMGRYADYAVTVTNTDRPLAATMIMGCTWCDFDLYVYDPNGYEVASSTGTNRQEQIGYIPTIPGTYTVEVYSYWGAGNFSLDVSHD